MELSNYYNKLALEAIDRQFCIFAHNGWYQYINQLNDDPNVIKECVPLMLQNLEEELIAHLQEKYEITDEQLNELEKILPHLKKILGAIMDSGLSISIPEKLLLESKKGLYVGKLIVWITGICNKSFYKFYNWWVTHPTNSLARIYIELYVFFTDLLNEYPQFERKYQSWKEKIIFTNWEEKFVKFITTPFMLLSSKDNIQKIRTGSFEYPKFLLTESGFRKVVFGIYYLFIERDHDNVFYNLIHFLVYCSFPSNVPFYMATEVHKILKHELERKPEFIDTLKVYYNVYSGDIEYLLNGKPQECKIANNKFDTITDNRQLNNEMIYFPESTILNRNNNNADDILYIFDNRLAMKVYDFLVKNQVFKTANDMEKKFFSFIQTAKFEYMEDEDGNRLVIQNIFGKICHLISLYVITEESMKKEWLKEVACKLYPNGQKKPEYRCTSPAHLPEKKIEMLNTLEKEMKKEYDKIYS